jgi:hypothetical protein
MYTFPEHATYRETLGPAMELQTEEEAQQYLEDLTQYLMKATHKTYAAAKELCLHNLGYYAGYYSDETRERVERIFHTRHPIFGAYQDTGIITPEVAFEKGRRMATSKTED